MKKLLSLVLVLAMLLGCTAMAEAVDYTGVWVLTGAETAGVQAGPTMLAALGVDMTLVVSEDGTVTLTDMGVTEYGVWTVTENGISISDETETLEAIYVNDMLVMEQGGALMMLTREGAAPAVNEETQLGGVLANVDPAAFEGQWLLTGASLMGMEFTADMMGVYIAFVLSNGQGIYGESNAAGGVDQYPIIYTVTEVEGAGTVLELLYAGEDVEEPVTLLVLTLLDDGRLVYVMDQDGITLTYYFTLQVEEAAE